MRQPSNDNQTDDVYWYGCTCGSHEFNVIWRDGFPWLTCAKCRTDYTMEVAGKYGVGLLGFCCHRH